MGLRMFPCSQAVEQVLVNEILYGASYGDPAYFVLLAKLGFGGNLTAAGEFARNYFLEDIVFQRSDRSSG